MSEELLKSIRASLLTGEIRSLQFELAYFTSSEAKKLRLQRELERLKQALLECQRSLGEPTEEP